MSISKKISKSFPLWITIGILIVFVISLPYLALIQQSIISVSKIEIQPGGYEDPTTHEWKGSFWVITMTVDMKDQVGTYKFNSGQTATTSDGKKVETKSTIEIQIDPQQPFYARQMKIASEKITPKTFGYWLNKISGGHGILTESNRIADVLNSGHFEWESSSRWEKYSPFSVTVLKNGVKVGDTLDFNTEAGSKVLSVSTSEGSIAFNNLGLLAGKYGEPQFGDVMYFTQSDVYKLDSTSKAYLMYDISKDSFSVYWFGGLRWNVGTNEWSDTPIPNHRAISGFELGDEYYKFFSDTIKPSDRKGWKEEGSTWDTWNWGAVDPTLNDVFSYLNSKVVPIINTDLGSGRGSLRTSDSKFVVNVPFSALNEGSAIFQIFIPTELADTVVWQPQVSNVKVTNALIPTEIGDKFDGWIELKQESTVRSTATVSLSFNPSTLSVVPSSFGITLDPQEVKKQSIQFLNPYSTEERMVTLTVTVKNNLGSTTDTKTYQIKQLIRAGGISTLTVYTQDSVSLEYVSGIFVTVKWDTQSKGEYTSGGSTTFEMGTFTGTVTISSAETPTYKSSTESKQLVLGPNSVTLKLIKQGVIEIPWWQKYLWLIILGSVVIVAVVIIATQQKKLKIKGVKRT